MDDPGIRLSRGETTPIDVAEGGLLTSNCYLDDALEDDYTFAWVRVNNDGSRDIIHDGQNLELADVSFDLVNDPIFCEATRLEDGETFEKQLHVRMSKLVKKQR